jgi:exonuclease III
MNVQSIDSDAKRNKAVSFIEHTAERADIIGLTETRLQSRFKLKNYGSLQTRYSKQGGVWSTCTSSRNVRHIKAISNNITWISAAYFKCPVHIVTCYFPPVKNDEVKMALNDLDWVINSIFRKALNSRVVVMGDFNFHLN